MPREEKRIQLLAPTVLVATTSIIAEPVTSTVSTSGNAPATTVAFSRYTIQPADILVPHDVPFEEGQTDTILLRFTASDLAIAIAADSALVSVSTRLSRIVLLNDGMATAIRIAMTAIVIISSGMVKPCMLRAVLDLANVLSLENVFTENLRLCLVLKLAVADHHRNPYRINGDSTPLSGSSC